MGRQEKTFREISPSPSTALGCSRSPHALGHRPGWGPHVPLTSQVPCSQPKRVERLRRTRERGAPASVTSHSPSFQRLLPPSLQRRHLPGTQQRGVSLRLLAPGRGVRCRGPWAALCLPGLLCYQPLPTPTLAKWTRQ
ncbi:H(+)/Cl(-) exchange transporter 4 [Platysternon megacephalum]|uniref:H(+)/Cl(-) exchange transporter 4 n=1 Tax=Platysternon megacephalum TaxID=55544 RepID=A0A4D9EIX2_9SAUR|nr:H(+)/Cl(-) exchange transporter 4 [Platysternon megacephalum]